MGELLAAVEQSSLATYFRSARWGYALLSASHILGISLLFGASLPLALRLLGLWAFISRDNLARVLVPIAAAGLVLAVASGALLFSVRATGYAGLSVFWFKLAVIAVGTASAVVAHARFGIWFEKSGRIARVEVAIVSLLCWTSALIAGRLIAFMGN